MTAMWVNVYETEISQFNFSVDCIIYDAVVICFMQ